MSIDFVWYMCVWVCVYSFHTLYRHKTIYYWWCCFFSSFLYGYDGWLGYFNWFGLYCIDWHEWSSDTDNLKTDRQWIDLIRHTLYWRCHVINHIQKCFMVFHSIPSLAWQTFEIMRTLSYYIRFKSWSEKSEKNSSFEDNSMKNWWQFAWYVCGGVVFIEMLFNDGKVARNCTTLSHRQETTSTSMYIDSPQSKSNSLIQFNGFYQLLQCVCKPHYLHILHVICTHIIDGYARSKCLIFSMVTYFCQ